MFDFLNQCNQELSISIKNHKSLSSTQWMNSIYKMNHRLIILVTMLILFLCSTTTYSMTVEVDVALPLKKKIVDLDEYTGRFRAIEQVDIRARVTGYLESIKFKDGQMIKKGDVLFVIDPRPFEYILNRNKAQYDLAKKQYARVMKLRKHNHVSEEAIDQRYQEMQVAKTQVDEAKLNLEFTQVKSHSFFLYFSN